MNKTTLLAASLSLLSLVACAPADTEDAATSEDAFAADGPALRVDATWRRVVTGTPTYGYDATTPMVAIGVRVNDAAVRRTHPDFDGFERAVAYVPRADGTTERRELPFRYTTWQGYIQLYPVDVHEAAAFFVSEADLAVIRRDGITVTLETNAGVVGGDNVAVVANNP
ncbi:MAG: hypothetical protein KIT84_44355 [Labilithrix sp.]|nr:hypothetical protein [Labilithrix sp.]MCW5818112.1 hypothetical protein [Labilithrix sp.]